MIRISNIKVDIKKDNYLEKISKIIKNNEIIDYKIVKKSIDARDKNNILFVYTIDISTNNEDKFINNKNVIKTPVEEYKMNVTGKNKMSNRPIVVGSGPAGLFAAYFLAKNNYKPLIIERGEKVEDRVKSVEEFFDSNKLNVNSNVQFGEGGAGTFSDGKLNTGIKDKEHRIKEVLKIFVECGAPEEILYLSRPHIGTDILRKVIINLRERIISYGGEFRYSTQLTNINVSNNKLISIEVNNNEIIDCDNMFLCIGHSARDTFRMLFDNKISMTNKNFAVGFRVSHLQKDISYSMYGNNYKYLDPAYYKLTYNSGDRGVYSFCMCPGGYVVNSSSEENKLVVNGMSNYDRSSDTANSAIVVTVNSKDYGNHPLDGIKFQEKLEEKAFKLGNGLIPIQRYIDFKNNNVTTDINTIINTCGGYSLTNLRGLLSDELNKSFIEGMEYFASKIDGFNKPDTILYGIESRTSSPVRIIRDENGISNIGGIYPTGEGTGYAGGITSSAVDGIKQVEKFVSKYSPFV